MKKCMCCKRKLDIISWLFGFNNCGDCRSKYSMGWSLDEIRNNGLHSEYHEEYAK